MATHVASIHGVQEDVKGTEFLTRSAVGAPRAPASAVLAAAFGLVVPVCASSWPALSSRRRSCINPASVFAARSSSLRGRRPNMLAIF